MQNIILEKIARTFLVIIIIVSIWLLFRGHNAAGGGFIAGIIAATGFVFLGIVSGSTAIEKILVWNTRVWIGTGLIIIIVAMLIPVIIGQSPLTAVWLNISTIIPITVHIGTPLLLDVGIYIAVIGIILSILITIMEVLKWNS